MVRKKSGDKKLKLGLAAIFFIFGITEASQALALSAAVHVPEKYTQVEAGDRFYFEIEIKYPENPSRKDLRLVYQILKGGEIISESQVLKAVETQASFMDFIVIPEEAKKGSYSILVKIADYADLNERIEASFYVDDNNNQTKLFFFIILGAILFLGMVISWQISRLYKKI